MLSHLASTRLKRQASCKACWVTMGDASRILMDFVDRNASLKGVFGGRCTESATSWNSLGTSLPAKDMHWPYYCPYSLRVHVVWCIFMHVFLFLVTGAALCLAFWVVIISNRRGRSVMFLAVFDTTFLHIS